MGPVQMHMDLRFGKVMIKEATVAARRAPASFVTARAKKLRASTDVTGCRS